VTRHVDAEDLARFHEGDLHGWRAWRARSHLSQCSFCTELAAQLAEIPALLASVPEPPIPAHVTARIQGVLAREAAQRTAVGVAAATTDQAPSATERSVTGEPNGTAEGRSGTWSQHRRNRPPRRQGIFGWPVGLRTAAAAAAVAVLAVAGVEIAQHVGTGASSNAASGSSRSAPFSNGRGIAPGPALYYTHNGQQYRISAISTKTNFTPGQLSSQVSELASARSSSAAGPAVAPAAPVGGTTAQPASGTAGVNGTYQNFSIAGLSGCLNRIAAGNLLVVLVDVAQYQGAPATVIVAELSDAGPLQVWVVGTGCSASRSDTLAHTQLGSGS
jgi:hypothetical protein